MLGGEGEWPFGVGGRVELGLFFFRVSPFLWDFLPCVKNPGDSQGSGLGCRGSAIGVFSREVYTVRMKTELSLIETVDERCACPCDPELG